MENNRIEKMSDSALPDGRQSPPAFVSEPKSILDSERRNRLRLIFTVIIVFALSAAALLTIYQCDNKYTAQGPKARDGVLVLDSESLESCPVLFLTDGWEYYGNRLLTPADFTTHLPVPDQYVFIGRFGGFEKWNEGSPHGSASYRLTIHIPEQPDTYLLELPEIFSAYRLYINGKQVMQMGEPDPEFYQPETGNHSISIEAGGRIEILFAVSDYSHLYSGIIYPPAFGKPKAVSRLLSARLVFRSLLCAAALTIGLLTFMVGLLARRNALALQFGLLCLFFVGYTGYPLTLTLFTGFRAHYAIENVSFCAMLCVSMLIAMQVSGLPKKRGALFILFGVLMCAASVFLHLLLPLGSLRMMLAYSRLVSVYEWITAGFIIINLWHAVRKAMLHITPLLYGVVIFVCALIADRLLPLHEPILTGWFIELASFALVLCIGAMTGQEVAVRYRESAVTVERANSMERLYKSQLSHFRTLKQEVEQTKNVRHDLRHHFTLMNEYAQNGQYDNLMDYLKQHQDHIDAVAGELPEYCPIDVINILTHHYCAAAQQNHIHLDIRCDLGGTKDPGHTDMTDSDLCCLYSNLMENAVEGCRRVSADRRFIRVAVFRTAPDMLNIRVWNSAKDVRQSGGRILSSKRDGQAGYGLMSIQAITEKYGGTADFRWKPDEKEFESKVMVRA